MAEQQGLVVRADPTGFTALQHSLLIPLGPANDHEHGCRDSEPRINARDAADNNGQPHNKPRFFNDLCHNPYPTQENCVPATRGEAGPDTP